MDEIAFLEHIVRIPSHSYQEAEVASYLVKYMQHLGFEAHRDDAGNAIGSVGTQGPLVVLLGHIDTVPGNIPVRMEDGKLYGRGSVDAKGPFATFVCATAKAAQQKSLSCRVVLIGAVEEEVASSKGAHYVVDTYRPDYCIIGEPSQWDRITLGYRGRLLVHYRREQAGAHSAGETRAVSEHMVAFWSEVERYCTSYNEGRSRLFEQLSPSLRHVASGSDGLNDWAEATLSLRLSEGIAPETLADTFRSFADNEAIVDIAEACPAFRSPRTTRLANAFVRAIRATGSTPGFVNKTGTSDMNIVGPAWNIPIVAYGPGDSRLDHTPEEHIVLEDYHRAIDVVTHVLENIGL
jgi:[amino group carrier protein]-lysine/ornithine hydrolase